MGIDVWVERAGTEDAHSGAEAPAVPADTPPSGASAVADSAEAGDASDLDIRSMDWVQLERAVRGCTRCPLHENRTQAVFGVGNREADWMIVGEAPGAEEDRRGEPFVGRAGQLLDAMLAAIGFSRDDVFIANVLKSRPPGNRDPKPEEVGACEPYLMRQIELVRPSIIVVVGRVAAQCLLHTDSPLGRMRGRVHEHAASGTPVVVTYHPAYLLRTPAHKQRAWEDLCLARRTAREDRT